MKTGLRHPIIVSLVASVIAIYGMFYWVLTRAAFARTDAQGIDGFYFSDITSKDDLWKHHAWSILYWPLIEIDCRLGNGRRPANPPMYNLH